MKNYLGALLLGAFLAPLGAIHAADDFADFVVDYSQNPGSVSGPGSDPSFGTSSVALGAPTTGTDYGYPYGITYAPYYPDQIVGIASGGYLKLGFDTPITHDPLNHAFGMDFTIFGNQFFDNFSSGDGTIAGAYTHPGLSVWVSQDNVTYYQLHVPQGYGADDWFPGNSIGDPLLPVNPSLTMSDFIGLDEDQGVALYNGSGGGASFSIGWAEDAGGASVNLSSISYVEIEGTSGGGYIDAVSRVEDVPEPCVGGLLI
jgi:hypothetical protein